MSIPPLDQHPSEGGRYVQNAVRVDDCGTPVYLASTHQHDFRTHVCQDKVEISVDGGPWYLKRSYTPGAAHRFADWSIKHDDRYALVCARLLWGTRGKDGKQAVKLVPLATCTLDHLEAIQRTESWYISPLCQQVVAYWIMQRKAEAKQWKATQRKSGRNRP